MGRLLNAIWRLIDCSIDDWFRHRQENRRLKRDAVNGDEQ